MEFKQRKQITVLALVVLALSAITTLSGASAASASTPDDCLVYAYVEDGYAHYSLVMHNSTLVGTDLVVRATPSCGVIEVVVNNRPRIGGEVWIELSIPLETNTIELNGEGWNQTFSNLTIYPAGDFTAGVEQYRIPDPITLSLSDLEESNFWLVIRSSILLWFITTVLFWKVLNFIADRFHCEEVVA
ncbi:MAG: hypothetical protein CMA22_08300 [Euryarchaeota archaeon]|jgi:hypothetical protein|nr:hypothetical protein [Euryarchaeota archaeon]MAU73659.1 hypothetical protein [Euryarchaeota archaeon]MAU74182.1 hypothetical protein [Euryarchaeota archaeon]MAU75168.1 hypothetical protein [Euryarchaeota archaeon]|tara:strand:+ start:4179 stop:4742 length:564 start_codon:yes stop_codon:yes gene_type:complete